MSPRTTPQDLADRVEQIGQAITGSLGELATLVTDQLDDTPRLRADLAIEECCRALLTQPDLPLAGVGNSGMGAYHGHHGFLQFSHSKAVYRQGLFSLSSLIRPPYGERKMTMIDYMT
mgnify:CR=1 FL=1